MVNSPCIWSFYGFLVPEPYFNLIVGDFTAYDYNDRMFTGSVE